MDDISRGIKERKEEGGEGEPATSTTHLRGFVDCQEEDEEDRKEKAEGEAKETMKIQKNIGKVKETGRKHRGIERQCT